MRHERLRFPESLAKRSRYVIVNCHVGFSVKQTIMAATVSVTTAAGSV